MRDFHWENVAAPWNGLQSLPIDVSQRGWFGDEQREVLLEVGESGLISLKAGSELVRKCELAKY